MKMNGILTRRDFLGASVLAFQGVLLMPDAAHADQANASVLELDGSIEAREMWAEAVKRADQENSPIISSEDDLCSIQVDPLNGVYSNARTISVSKRSQIGLINDVIIISADYGVTSTNRISPFNWARLYCSASSVKRTQTTIEQFSMVVVPTQFASMQRLLQPVDGLRMSGTSMLSFIIRSLVVSCRAWGCLRWFRG